MSAFKVIAAGLHSGQMKGVELPTERVDHRRLSVDEIKTFIKEEFAQAKEAKKEKKQEKDWGDAELAKEIEWAKALDLKEFFERK